MADAKAKAQKADAAHRAKLRRVHRETKPKRQRETPSAPLVGWGCANVLYVWTFPGTLFARFQTPPF
eukprot:1752877-Karenia_brevis.AAC.1